MHELAKEVTRLTMQLTNNEADGGGEAQPNEVNNKLRGGGRENYKEE